MAVNRTLKAGFTGAISVNYRRTDQPISPNIVKGDIRYSIKKLLTNGVGAGKADLLYQERRIISNGIHIFNLDGGLVNVWGDVLNYDAIKLLCIVNRQSIEERKFLSVQFKNERYYIGPQGERIIVEPIGMGIASVQSSESSEEGQLVITSDNEIEYDIIIVGASRESSSSSGL